MLRGNYLKLFELAPSFADRLRGARLEGRLAGAPTPNYFRKPYGPGWALVGDAGYIKDPITAQGINDAFRDAERCALALDEGLTGGRSLDDAMGDYRRDRDARVLPMYEFTCQLATLEPPPSDMQQLFSAIHGNQKAMDGFARVNAGTNRRQNSSRRRASARFWPRRRSTHGDVGAGPGFGNVLRYRSMTRSWHF
jgi:flavin-dependent dehydrogenase